MHRGSRKEERRSLPTARKARLFRGALPFFFFFFFILLTVLASATAHAQPTTTPDSDAKAEAVKAGKAFEARSYRTAAEGYESAFSKFPSYGWLRNAARARQRNGDLAKAANEYARVVNETPATDKHHVAAKKELATLAPKLGRLEIKADGASKVTLDGETIDLTLTPTLYVTADAHLVEARFGDQTTSASPTTPVNQVTSVVLKREGAEPASSAPAPAAAAVEAPADPSPVVVVHANERERPRPVPPIAIWIGAGATVVLGGLTVFSGLDVLSQKDTFDTTRSQENLDAGKDKEVRTNILLVTTIAVAAITGVAAIWFVDWRKGTKPSSAASLLMRGMF